MRTYLFDTFNRYKRFSEELDAKTILCNKSWWVFNDSGEKEVYIFNTDGTLIISVSGRVTNATWKYIPVNKSIIISGNNQSYMLHPAFYDNMIFTLQMDGANEYAFLIDEQNLSSTNLKTFNDLVVYFAEKERQAILAEERKRQVAIEVQRQRETEVQQEKLQRIKDNEEGMGALESILYFVIKCAIMYIAWYLVPLLYRLTCINVLGKSQEWIESYPYGWAICLSIEAILAIILFKPWKIGRSFFISLIIYFIIFLFIGFLTV